MFFFNKILKEKDNYAQTSFSQSGEDLIVKFIFNNLGIKNPTYLDIGAHHPFYLSNTALFYMNGSTGINVEPDPDLFKAFLTHRKKDININIGIGDQKGVSDFYIISSPTLNTFSKEDAENYTKEGNYNITSVKKIPINSVTNIINEKNNGEFPQFLNVDAEGVDELIIKSINYTHNYPLVICIETISFSTSGKGVKNTSLINFISNNGYIVYADTNINTIFVREDIWKKSNDHR